MKKLVLFIIMNFLILGETLVGRSYVDKKDLVINPIEVEKNQNEYFVLDYFSGKVINYDKNLELQRVYSGIDRASSIEIFNGYIYATETSNNRIIKIDIYTGEKTYIGKNGLRRGEFLHPVELRKDDENLFVIDEYNGRIQVFDKKDQFVKEIIIPNNKGINTNYAQNYSLALLDNEKYILDIGNKSIYYFKNDEYIKEITLENFSHPSRIYEFDREIYVYEDVKNELVNINTNEKISLLKKEKRRLIDLRTFYMNNKEIYYIDNFNLKKLDTSKNKDEVIMKFNKVEESVYIKPVDIEVYNKEVFILDKEKNTILVYDLYNTFKREMNFNLGDIEEFEIDENGDFVLFSSTQNSLVKYDKDAREIFRLESYEILPYSEIPWLIKNGDYKGFTKDINPNNYMGHLTLNRDNGEYYLLNNNSKNIGVFNVRLAKIGTRGKGESKFNQVLGRKGEKAFSNDYSNINDLTDVFYYEDYLYVLDNNYKRLYKVGSKGVEEYHSGDYDSLNSIYIEDDIIYLVDTEGFNIYMLNMDFTPIKTINFASKGYMPIKIYKNYLIVREYLKDFEESYKVINIIDLF